MEKQPFLKIFLVLQTLAVLVYTFFAFQNEGSNLLQVFVTNIMALQWNGQFNLDFSCYLLLSGLWIMWRNHFSASSILLSIVATIIGIMVFAPYLLYLLFREKGDLKKVLVG
jgi:hypothetical protein